MSNFVADHNHAAKLSGDAANAPEVVNVARSPAVARLIAQLIGGDGRNDRHGIGHGTSSGSGGNGNGKSSGRGGSGDDGSNSSSSNSSSSSSSSSTNDPGSVVCGADRVTPVSGCQLALRYPRCVDSLVAGGAACRFEVDGRSWHTDGLRQGKKHSFSLLVGVALSDCGGGGGFTDDDDDNDDDDDLDDIDGDADLCCSDDDDDDDAYDCNGNGGDEGSNREGNLCVWPGSHYVAHGLMRHPDGKVRRELSDAAKERRRAQRRRRQQQQQQQQQQQEQEELERQQEEDAEGGESDDDYGYESEDGPLPDLGPHRKLRLRTGDVVLAHSELAHCGGPNLGCDIRYMLYYRVRHRDWAQMVADRALVHDMWCDLEGTWRVNPGATGHAMASGV